MFEGDIQVTPEQIDNLQKGINQRGSIIGKRWPNARIPYAFESSMGKLICFFDVRTFLLRYIVKIRDIFKD